MRLYYFIFIFFSILFHAQHYTSRWYGMDDGLPQNSIKDIAKDKYGFIWLSTDGGILRYDGESFILYNDFKISSLSFKDFLVLENRDMICFNNNEEQCILISERSPKLFPQGEKYVTYLVKDNKLYKKYYKNSLINEFYPDISCYYIETSSGVYVFDGQKVKYKSSNGTEKILIEKNFRHRYLRNAFEHNGIIYIADPANRRTAILKNGMVSYDTQPSLYNDPKSKIYWHQGNQQVFVINNGNIYLSKIFNGKPTLTFLLQYKDIENEFLYCMFYDEESHKMYFGNVVKGLNIINLSNFYVPQRNIPFSGEVVYESLPFTRNSVITKDGLEYYKDRAKKIYYKRVKDKRMLLYDNSHNLLYVEYDKIHRRYKSSNYQKHDSISFPEMKIEGLFKVDQYYISNASDTKRDYYYLYVFPDDQFKKTKTIFRFKDVVNFIEGVHDLIYVGTNNGIYIISISNKKVIKHVAQNLPIKEIQQTKDGNIWFTTYNKGFYLLKDNKMTKMPDDKKKYISDAHRILEDHHGFFWISSNNGLFKVSKKMLLKYAQNKNTEVTYYRYTKENGFLNNEFNGSANSSGSILANGEFVFPSMEGFVFFKPDEVKAYYPKSNQLYIERAKVGKEIISFKDTLRLKSDYQNAEIFFDIPYYYNLENIYLEAKLENDDDGKWDKIKNGKIFTLNNLAPGNYNLLVRFLVSENGKFTYKKIYIEIKPFFYQTLLFKIGMGLLVLLAIIFIIQVRTNFLRITNKKLKNNLYNRNQELKKTSDTLELTKNKLKNEAEYQHKIMESISHDITTPVKFIALLSQKLSNADNAANQKKYFDSIYKTSEQLFKFTLGLKEYTELYKEESVFDDEEHSLYHLIEDKKLLFEELASNNGTRILNISDPGLKIKTNKNILSAILHNLIDNAVKNTVNGEIQIKTFKENDQVEIGIFDTGKGMSQSQIAYYSQVFEKMESDNFVFKNYGLGLHMVIQLSRKINAKISFHENTPKGTIVKIFLKN